MIKRLPPTSLPYLALAVALVPQVAHAQQRQDDLPASSEDDSDSHAQARAEAEIVVTGVIERGRADFLSGISVLSDEQLAQAVRPSLGETLNETPGVSATSFGPSASRPVLRGLQGERVRVLTNGLGSVDVSNTSVDHAVVVNPLTAEKIEVLRGPQSLLYGSSAIGGVVNVLDNSLPRTVPAGGAAFGATATYGSAANERSGGVSADVALSDRWVVHADGSYLKTDDLRIGGYALTPALREQALASAQLPPDPNDPIDFAAIAAIKGKLPNTAAETWTAGAGIGFIDDGGNFALSYKHYDSLYGVPIRYATEPGQEQEGPRLDLTQDRFDARAEINVDSGLLDKIGFRYGYASYRHDELEEDGAIGTSFFNKGMEGRLELTQAERGAWRGVTGGQFMIRDFNVIGEEAFLPKNSTEQVGAFTLQQFEFGPLKAEAGVRYEHTRLSAQPLPDQPQFFDGSRSYDAISGSVGASYGLVDGVRLGMNLSHNQRASAAEELFANGPHAGTSAFEVGDPDLSLEKSWSVEGILRANGDGYSLEASAYYSWFDNFIYEDQTGAYEDGLPVFQIRQADARYYGFEVQGTATLARFGGTRIEADALADYVHAEITDVGPAPRIPPLRVLGGLSASSDHVDVRGEVEHVFKQDRIAGFETPTDGFTLVNAEVNLHPWGVENPLSFALSANNIFDVTARRHASFLKDYAPLPGRDLRISARLAF